MDQLHQLSGELQRNHTMLASATNFIQAQTMRKRVDELTAEQSRLMDELVELYPDAEARDRYRALSSRIEELQKQIKTSQDIQELRELEGKIESTVGEWVHHFQSMVAALMGAPPPQNA
ncbi:MAG: hypothetical protein HY319_02780 [Armatimonadetes bacterium]|nr:hypothetical protein [Armatimonadota bacterium]